MSNRVAAIADFNQEVARAAGHFAAQALWICCSGRPLLGSLIKNLGGACLPISDRRPSHSPSLPLEREVGSNLKQRSNFKVGGDAY
jgi:hypothetical protein